MEDTIKDMLIKAIEIQYSFRTHLLTSIAGTLAGTIENWLQNCNENVPETKTQHRKHVTKIQ